MQSKTYDDKLQFEVDKDTKYFIFSAARKHTNGGAVRPWAVNLLIKKAEKIHGIKFSDFKRKLKQKR